MEIWKPTPMEGVKWLIPRMYTFDDKSQYKTYKIPCKYKYSTVEVNAILRKVKTFLATYVYIPCVISDWYLAKLQGVMEHKNLYRFEAKRNLEEIKSIVRKSSTGSSSTSVTPTTSTSFLCLTLMPYLQIWRSF